MRQIHYKDRTYSLAGFCYEFHLSFDSLNKLQEIAPKTGVLDISEEQMDWLLDKKRPKEEWP